MLTQTLSRRASVASSSEASLVDPAAVAKLLPKKDIVVGKVKFKKLPPKPKAKESEANEINPDGTPRSPSPDSPLINEIDPDLRATFPTGRPLDDRAEMIQCKHCRKPMLTSVAASHIKICLQKKQDRNQKKKEAKEAARKAREARDRGDAQQSPGPQGDNDSISRNNEPDNESLPSSSQTLKTSKKATPADKSKKRKADADESKDAKRKKTKKEIEAAKPKIPKPKGPVDVEKQCGVALSNGAFCARSLTCKSHSMGAKRSVPGRSLPYDMLLAAYQKKNQAKQQKAAIDANAPLLDEGEAGAGPVDSDEEKEAVMSAVGRSRPRPLEQHVFVPIRKRYAYVRMKEMLSQALGGSRGGGLFGAVGATSGGGSGATLPNDEAASSLADRRSSIAPSQTSARGSISLSGTGVGTGTGNALGLGGPASRKTSIVGAA